MLFHHDSRQEEENIFVFEETRALEPSAQNLAYSDYNSSYKSYHLSSRTTT